MVRHDQNIATSAEPQASARDYGHRPRLDAPLDEPQRTPSLIQVGSFAGLVIEALIRLTVFDVLSRRGFKRVHAYTRSFKVAKRTPSLDSTSRVCDAVAEACVWYLKRAQCLQRSTVITWMLRRRGVAANVVIGYRPVPIDSHAWVEVDGRVVNDYPQYQKFFQVVDRL